MCIYVCVSGDLHKICAELTAAVCNTNGLLVKEQTTKNGKLIGPIVMGNFSNFGIQ